MFNSDNISNRYIIGEFESSFSTNKLDYLPIKTKMHQSIELKSIELRGRKTLVKSYFSDVIFNSSNDDLFFREILISGVEIYPLNKLNELKFEPKKFNLKDVLITDLSIENEQIINGVTHGKIKGILTAKIYCESSKKVLENKIQNEILIEKENSNQTNSNDTLILDVSADKKPIGNIVSNSGCLSFFKNGCLGLLLFLLLLAILSFLLRECSNSDDLVKAKTEIPNDSDDKLIKDNQIIEKDSSSIVNEKTIKEFKTISLPNVQFFTNSDKLLPSSKEDLNQLAIYLLQNQGQKATIYGHTDNVGSEDRNLKLSQNRAESVLEYLTEQGVQKNRLYAIGKGESEPKASNDILEGRLMNRRVEVQISETKSVENNKTN